MKTILTVLVSFLVIGAPDLTNGCTVTSLVDNLSTTVADAINSASTQGGLVTVDINDLLIVCLSTAETRGIYTSVSVLVNMTCTGGRCLSSNIQQFEFRCDAAMNWFSPTDNFAEPAEGATFTTPLRTNCGLCTRLTSSSPVYDRYDNATHCVGCSELCNSGLRECYGILDENCCIGIDNNSCVQNCTAPERPLPTANYTCSIFCDPLTEPSNSNIMRSDGDLLNSVATYSCADGYELQGNMQRTCQVTGKTTMWSNTETSCTRIMTNSTCDKLELGDNQRISYSTNCTVEVGCQASYSCKEGYELMGGASFRTCSLQSDSMPVWEGVAPKCVENDNKLSQAEIAGIGIGVSVVVAAVIIAIVVITIVILSRQ